jgi:ribonuclease HI
MDGINSWILNWKKNGWKTANKKPVKNMELWIELDKLNTFHDVDWHWVKGHSGDSGNDMADELANQGIDNL